MKFRQTFVPRTILNDKALKLLHQGVLYVHGKTKDHMPIVICDCGSLRQLLRNNEIDPPTFLAVHHYISNYITSYMTIKGQNERWFVICNINKFPIKELPVMFFKDCAAEICNNFIELNSTTVVVNLSWVQNMIAKLLQSFLDPHIAARQVFSDVADDVNIKKYVYPSQLETTYGGTAPVATKFWPPIMPPMVEEQEDMSHNPDAILLSRQEYIPFVKKHPKMRVMPPQMRQDLPELESKKQKVTKILPDIRKDLPVEKIKPEPVLELPK